MEIRAGEAMVRAVKDTVRAIGRLISKLQTFSYSGSK